MSRLSCTICKRSLSPPSVKQHLAALRMLFDWLVTGGILATNPAHAVRGPKHVVKRGKTFALLAQNDLAERTLASYAVADNALFIRSETHMWRLGN